MLESKKVTEHETVVGLFATINKGKSENQRWRVNFGGVQSEPFESKEGAETYARLKIAEYLAFRIKQEIFPEIDFQWKG